MKNKFKIIAFMIVILCVAVIAYGCGKNDNDSETEITDSITTMTANAASVSENINFDFERVYYYAVDDENSLTIYHEITTDTLFLQLDGYSAGGITQMLDPKTCKPLTYAVWLEKYANK